jgi:hypothetical protein
MDSDEFQSRACQEARVRDLATLITGALFEASMSQP